MNDTARHRRHRPADGILEEWKVEVMPCRHTLFRGSNRAGRQRRSRWVVAPLLAVLLLPGYAVHAAPGDESAEPAPTAVEVEPEAEAVPDVPLEETQESIVRRFRDFEDNLLRMEKYLRKVQPEQAELIYRAYKQSKDKRVSDRMASISEVLKTGEFGAALEGQGEVLAELQSLLKLLQSGDSLDKNRKEQQRIEDLIKDLNRIERNERDVRKDTERGGDPIELADRQGRIAEQTQRLVDKIDGQDAARAAEDGEGQPGEGKPGEGKPGEGKPGEGKPGEGKPGEGKPGEGKPGEGKPGEGKPGEGKPGEGKPGEGKPGEGKPSEGKPGEGKPGEGKPGEGKPGEGKPGEGKPGEGKPGEGKPGEGKPGEGKPGEGKPGEGKPGEGKPGEGKPGEGGESGGPTPPGGEQDPNADDKKTPGRDDIQRAKEEMERAIEELRKKERDAASGHQDKALEELAKAREKLEEILRQLREEERKLLLAALRSRFERMLEMQRAVTRGTVALSKVTEFGNNEIAKASRLSADEDKIRVEADKALTILKEEGSSVAFPEAVEQIREDMVLVAQRLSPQLPVDDPRADAGEITQAIEKDIEEALAELIEALEKELEKAKKKEGQPPPPGPMGEPPDPALVDKLAELKMLRSLQNRINRRTKLLGRQIDGEQATADEILEQLQQLGQRQSAIQRAAYDLATGRNQ